MLDLQKAPKESVIYEDEKLYVCLASYPLSNGHVIVAWKDRVRDIHTLKRNEYEHLMLVVEDVRNALLKTLNIDKVYLMYLDEIKHVHWHLVPRYDEKGYALLSKHPQRITDFSLVAKIKQNLVLNS